MIKVSVAQTKFLGEMTERQLPYASIWLKTRAKRARKWVQKRIGAWGESREEAEKKLAKIKAEFVLDFAEVVEHPEGVTYCRASVQTWEDGTEMVMVPMFF